MYSWTRTYTNLNDLKKDFPYVIELGFYIKDSEYLLVMQGDKFSGPVFSNDSVKIYKINGNFYIGPFKGNVPVKQIFPDPTQEMLHDPLFDTIWEVIKTWDVNVPSAYVGYCGANGNHVRAIYDAIVEKFNFNSRP